MVRGVITRSVAAACAFVVATGVALGAAPGIAQAAPAPKAKPTAAVITGKDIQKITVENLKSHDLFLLLFSEVSWMSTATPQTTAPQAKSLGPKYSISIMAKTKATQVYDLYPQAIGGPRAHRGAKQPAGKVADGWFYGRLTMPESLRLAGVPIESRTGLVNGGAGGGLAESIKRDEVDPVQTANQVFGQMRQLFLLNGAVLVVIMFGLGGIAFLIRRKV